MGRKLLKTVQTVTTFWNPLADPLGTRRGPPLVRGPQFENRWCERLVIQVLQGLLTLFTPTATTTIFTYFLLSCDMRVLWLTFRVRNFVFFGVKVNVFIFLIVLLLYIYRVCI